MYFLDNPVLQRELLVNLRMFRAFILQAVYLGLLAALVLFAWPHDEKIDTRNPQAAKQLVNLFFLGQYILASMMAPTFAAGTITGEKERMTYEMLLASPLRPGAVVLGKLLASLTHLALLIFSSLPIVMLCLPLGGTSFYEVLAFYFALILCTITFGIISVACSSFFGRTSAALVVSYLIILPLAMLGLLFWQGLSNPAFAQVRLLATITFLPVVCIVTWIALLAITSSRLLHPPDVGSEGKEVVEEKEEVRAGLGLVIRRDQFPDKLFAPPKRSGLLPDGANPVFDKEMRAEIFSQGTLMLRVVIQVSMFLAIPLMAWCLYLRPQYVPWYMGYVVLFNILVGPVFSAGSVTGERERQTLELLLTTLITPGQILIGKLIAGLRVSSVLTSFLLWPLMLACAMVADFWRNMLTILGYMAVIAVTCVTTANWALFCSVLFRRTSVSLMTAYLIIVILFIAPLGLDKFVEVFFAGKPVVEVTRQLSIVSPISVCFQLPLVIDRQEATSIVGDWWVLAKFVGLYAAMNCLLLGAMSWLFRMRWRVVY